MVTDSKQHHTLRALLPFIWEFRGRAALALAFLVIAKIATVLIPVVLKHLVDDLNPVHHVALVLPLALLIGYGALRFASTLFGELRDLVFEFAALRAVRRIALRVFRHLHDLDLAFHLERQTGGLSRDIERGTRGVSFVLSFMLFNILPTLLEIALVLGIFLWNFSAWFALIIVGSVAVYIVFSIAVTEWRMQHVRRMNEQDSKANTRAVDSLLNYETVKYFTNEEFEASRYDKEMATWEKEALKTQYSLSTLNSGQALIIALGVTAMMLLAGYEVVHGKMTLGDFVMVNAYMVQLFMPLNFLGFVYREMKRSIVDMERMFALLERHTQVADKPGALPLQVRHGEIRFENVRFGYGKDREILHGVSFNVPAGQKVAVVGPSGAGKSTLARLMFRFYDANNGVIRIDGQDIREVTRDSLRSQLGIVPQDTVLFNDTIYYNIAYGRPDATRADIGRAAAMANLKQFIEMLPKGYDTLVGERGLKLSGGEKQRVAIARAILKNPPILVFDEATSSLDSNAEQAILAALKELAEHRTSLVIAHRLSTIVDADDIVVLDQGRIAEHGTHRELLRVGGLYAQLWTLQQREAEEREKKTAEAAPPAFALN
ncbi:MAG: ABC transporter ATP-binding protein/permease [Gammaproteobacteria bacterium]|nr:ABC transporter ATP-binding protein/permease [Gammaproteobacteria bacterium]MBU6509891.1 ABC transporter ATP-binding protein/permease [Gammaproteobacteria bacterium]MDE1984294.1 ABC transporter ATP-binding protein/permease [Gammaproteobacteria bacterium]MDE2461738.1 ABC transporter ATP-binding protein/permease [Gammaproteobacteria bacterium]